MVVDRFTKYTVFIFVCSDINAAELIKLIYSYIDIQFDLFLNIVFNRGFIFINEFWSNFYYYNKIKYFLSTMYYLQTDK